MAGWKLTNHFPLSFPSSFSKASIQSFLLKSFRLKFLLNFDRFWMSKLLLTIFNLKLTSDSTAQPRFFLSHLFSLRLKNWKFRLLFLYRFHKQPKFHIKWHTLLYIHDKRFKLSIICFHKTNKEQLQYSCICSIKKTSENVLFTLLN